MLQGWSLAPNTDVGKSLRRTQESVESVSSAFMIETHGCASLQKKVSA